LMQLLSLCIFLSQLLRLLPQSFSVFFFNVYFIFEPWFCVFCLFLSDGVAFPYIFYLIKETFYFQDFWLILFSDVLHIIVQFLFLILCSFLFFIYLFLIVSFVSLWCLF
jgi:hypothetical protein